MDTEKEKMLSGRPYQAFEEQLEKERMLCRAEIFKFNTLPPNDFAARNELIRKLFGKVNNKFYIEPPFRCDYGYNIEIGVNFYSNYNLIILDCAKVIIGDNAFIGPNVGIYAAGHPLHFEKRNEEFEYALPIKIGNNVWIGGSVVINPGITIGNNTVIGSGSVVTKNIPDNVIALGNPCKVLREITDADKPYYYKTLKFE